MGAAQGHHSVLGSHAISGAVFPHRFTTLSARWHMTLIFRCCSCCVARVLPGFISGSVNRTRWRSGCSSVAEDGNAHRGSESDSWQRRGECRGVAEAIRCCVAFARMCHSTHSPCTVVRRLCCTHSVPGLIGRQSQQRQQMVAAPKVVRRTHALVGSSGQGGGVTRWIVPMFRRVESRRLICVGFVVFNGQVTTKPPEWAI